MHPTLTMVMNSLQRVNDEDSSTLYCPCDATFRWTGVANDELDRWLLEHAPHVGIDQRISAIDDALEQLTTAVDRNQIVNVIRSNRQQELQRIEDRLTSLRVRIDAYVILKTKGGKPFHLSWTKMPVVGGVPEWGLGIARVYLVGDEAKPMSITVMSNEFVAAAYANIEKLLAEIHLKLQAINTQEV